MERAHGYIRDLRADEVDIHLSRDDGSEGIATLPLNMFGDWERSQLRDGSFVEAEIDHTELVISVKLSQVAMWTQEELDAAATEGKRLSAALNWK